MAHLLLSRFSGTLAMSGLFFLIVNISAFAGVYETGKSAGILQITGISPAKYSCSAPVNTSIQITFNEGLNTNTVSSAAIRVWGNVSGMHQVAIVPDNNIKSVTLTPELNFLSGEKVYVVLTNTITSLTGLQLSGGYSWEFQTAALLGSDTFKVASKIITPMLAPYALATGDFNRDGYPDLVTVNTNNNSISVYFNNTVGGFQAPQTYAADTGPSKIEVADINNDKAADIIVVNTGAKSIGVFKNDGSGGFGEMVSYSVGGSPGGLSVSDINNDGSLDIAVANFSDNSLTVLKNDGTGNFTSAQTMTVGTGPSAVVLVDLDNDGAVDAVVSNKNSNDITLLKGSGGILAFDTSYSISGATAPNDVAVFDFDKDGTPDIAISNGSSNNVAFLLNAYSGNRPGRFTLYTLFGRMIDLGVSPTVLYGNDFDADGDNDLVAGSLTARNSLTVLVNNGLGTVPKLIDSLVFVGTRGLVGADFSGQFGVIDLISSGSDGVVRTFRNQVKTKPAGTVKLSVHQIAFGKTTIGDTAWTSVAIYSLLTANKIDSVSISNSGFSIVHSLPVLLGAYDSSIVKISFAPKNSDSFSATLKVYTNSPAEVMSIPISGTGEPVNVKMDERTHPQDFSLEQNYPNPFNPTTRINYELPHGGTQYIVSLRVFDMLGRDVAVLVNGIKEPGAYNVTWDAANFATGMYIYTLMASPLHGTSDNMFIAAKKLILIK